MIRWGIMGTGYGATQFALGLQHLPQARIWAVGSRQEETAYRFAKHFGAQFYYSSYEKLMRDPTVDIIYIATPNALHKAHSLLCLEAGKAVLCEKPFALNAQQAQEVVTFARRQRLFCMEAMWMRFIPAIQHAVHLIKTGTIGQPYLMIANLGMRLAFNERGRHFNPYLGGGSLLDLGIYPISLAHQLWGPPQTVSGYMDMGTTQVDEQSHLLLHYPNQLTAQLSCSYLTHLPNEALIMGSCGMLRIQAPLYRPSRLSISHFTDTPPPTVSLEEDWKAGLKKVEWIKRMYEHHFSPWWHKPHTETIPYLGNGYHYEAQAVIDSLQKGELENSIMPLDETVQTLETLDKLRAQAQFKYPSEEN